MWVATVTVSTLKILATLFLSTPPVWVATLHTSQWCFRWKVSIHATRVGGDECVATYVLRDGVSIHATRVGGDCASQRPPLLSVCFYPRHPCGWRRRKPATPPKNADSFYPRHPCGWRLILSVMLPQVAAVSIHATRVGGDNRRATSARAT